MPGEDSTIEIRPVFEAEDFGQEAKPKLRALEHRVGVVLLAGEVREVLGTTVRALWEDVQPCAHGRGGTVRSAPRW